MSFHRRSLLDIESVSPEAVEELFLSAELFLKNPWQQADPLRSSHYVIALLFFEPSTRTRMSFEMAALRLGVSTIRLDDLVTSSLSKGESLTDTFQNVAAMRPQAVVVRYGEDADLAEVLQASDVPVLCAGQGQISHPTQALLDAFTIRQRRRQVRAERVLIVGDVAHSRVAYSNIVLLKKLGAEVAVCGPPELIRLHDRIASGVRIFSEVDEGLRWASVAMTLRIQLERMDHGSVSSLNRDQYRQQYGFTAERLKHLSPDGLILHPGPINQNVELDSDVLDDPRCQVLQQVTNGVAIRTALLETCLGLKESQ